MGAVGFFTGRNHTGVDPWGLTGLCNRQLFQCHPLVTPIFEVMDSVVEFFAFVVEPSNVFADSANI